MEIQLIIICIIAGIVIFFCNRFWYSSYAIMETYYKAELITSKAETKRYKDLYDQLVKTERTAKKNNGQYALIPDQMIDKTKTYRYVTDNQGYKFKALVTDLEKQGKGQHYVVRHIEEWNGRKWQNGKNDYLWVDSPTTDQWVYDPSANVRYYDEIRDNDIWILCRN